MEGLLMALLGGASDFAKNTGNMMIAEKSAEKTAADAAAAKQAIYEQDLAKLIFQEQMKNRSKLKLGAPDLNIPADTQDPFFKTLKKMQEIGLYSNGSSKASNPNRNIKGPSLFGGKPKQDTGRLSF